MPGSLSYNVVSSGLRKSGVRKCSRGGHAISTVGYDDNLMIGADKGALLVRNSWGTAWGDAGYGWLSYKYVTQGLTSDWWTLISERWVDTEVF